MPVKFYPSKPIDQLEKYIVKEDGSPLIGEIEIYRQLYYELDKSPEDWHIWHDLKLPFHSELFNDYNKTSSQIDFLILCNSGVLILEVKGGAISLYENCFYYGKNFDTKMKQNPFRQAEGYKYTLKDKILNNINKCFFCFAVAFPHVDYSFESRIFDNNILWTKYRESNYNSSIEQFLMSVFTYGKNQHKRFNRTYPKLNAKEIDSIKKILSPLIQDKSKYSLISTLEWLQINNLEILEGLYKNNRIMIEGPPGSGKTTMAKAYIDQQVGKKGLYLCWNNLLMHYTKQFIDERGIADIEIVTLIRFLKQLEPDLNIEALFTLSEEEFYNIVTAILKKLESASNLPHYDYIVVDEGQDIFDRGVDLLVDKLTGYGKNGLNNGNGLVLYDMDQSYLASGRNVLEIANLLSNYYSHFKLNEVRRSAQNPDIKNLAANIFENPQLILSQNCKNDYPNISITKHKDLEAVKKYIVSNFLNQMRSENSSLRGECCVLLVESLLMKDSYKGGPGMPYWLTIKDVEELNENNVSDKGNKLRYTTILKFKGLEKQNVFLVISSPSEKNKYELYVGVTRAICNLEIMIVE